MIEVPNSDGTRTVKQEGAATPEECRRGVEHLIAQIMDRKPLSVVIFAEYEKDGVPTVVSGAIGKPIAINELIRIGIQQVTDMIKRSKTSGENG